MRTTTPLLAAAIAALALLPASAEAASKYCSKSGDVCYGAFKGPTSSDQRIRLRITLAAHYFSRYRLCVTGPHGERDCHRFRVRRAAGGTYSSSVLWAGHFPYRGKGTYRARWSHAGTNLGPAVSF